MSLMMILMSGELKMMMSGVFRNNPILRKIKKDSSDCVHNRKNHALGGIDPQLMNILHICLSLLEKRIQFHRIHISYLS